MSRKLLLFCLVGLVGVLIFGLPAQAELQDSGPTAPAPEEGPNMIEGTVSGIDYGKNELSIGGVAGFLGTNLKVSAETKIVSKENKPLALNQIRKGDVIQARYRRVGDQNMATSIEVLSTAEPAAGPEGAGAGEAEGSATSK